MYVSPSPAPSALGKSLKSPGSEKAVRSTPVPSEKKFGTFAGVFTPSLLTILGIILFLRLTFIVGNAGLLESLEIIFVANAISILTSFSLAGISTNLAVKGGGDYYLISRTLGLSFGGALGIVLFAAQAISVGFYAIGFGEVAATLLGTGHRGAQLVAAITVVALFGLAWKGADLATRFQYVVMAMLVGALASFFVGAGHIWNTELLRSNLQPLPNAPPFWSLFALFFPAVTGFTQGVSMSGELRDAGRSIPLGTFAAVSLSLVLYVTVVVTAAGSLPQGVLALDYTAMKRVAAWSPMIDGGIFAATLSSALASFLGAPRILQSLAKDRIFRPLLPFAETGGRGQNPRRAVAFTGLIALAVVGLGDLNLVASIVTMFFLVSYGLLNYATYFEARSRSPSFRPRFAFYHESLSLIGAVGCVVVMFAIDPLSAVVATIIIGAIYAYLRARRSPARWADSQRSYHLQRARDHLISAAREIPHPRDWRPQLLVFSDDTERRRQLLRFATWIEGGAGWTAIIKIILESRSTLPLERISALRSLSDDIAEAGSSGFPLVVAARTLEDGIAVSIQTVGLGPLTANTALVNFGSGGVSSAIGDLDSTQFGKNLRAAFHLGCNLLVLRAKATEWAKLEDTSASHRSIHIWWTESSASSLSLILSHLMTRSAEWSDSAIKVFVAGGENGDRIEKVRSRLKESRIHATAAGVAEFTSAVVREYSAGANIVFLPMAMPDHEPFHVFGLPPQDFGDGLCAVVFVAAAEDIALTSDPDEGIVSQTARAADELSDAARRLADLEARIERTSRKLRQLTAAIKEGSELGQNVVAERKLLESDIARLTIERDQVRLLISDAEAKLQSIDRGSARD